MSYGLTTWDAQSNVQMTTDDFTYQIIHNQIYDLATTSTFYITIPEFDPEKCVAVILPIDPAPSISAPRNGLPYMGQLVGRIDIARRNPSMPARPYGYDSLLRFRLLVMRHKN